MKLLGKEVNTVILDNLKNSGILNNCKLAVFSVGDDLSAKSYYKGICKRAETLGVEIINVNFSHEIDNNSFIEHIDFYNKSDCDGIMILTPLPKHLCLEKIGNAIDPLKDVDCLNKLNTGEFYLSSDSSDVGPCTAKAVISYLKINNYELCGKHVCVVGASNIVGKPTSKLLLDLNATVTICNVHTKNLEDICRRSDVIVSCAGVANLIKKSMIKKDAFVIDVGINFVNGKMCGDVDYENCFCITPFITPVPGGVGVITSTIIFDNMAKLISKNKK